MNLDQIRREYLRGGLRRADLPSEPISLFNKWLQQAVDSGITDATAMVLATLAQQQPSQRIVLLKGLDAGGFVFYTNYQSRKGQEIAQNTKVSLLFPWHLLERQVKVLGSVVKTTQDESKQYFTTRPRDSQLAAWASAQSQPLRSRSELTEKLEVIKKHFGDKEVIMPPHWGGYRVIPHEIEFWQGGAHRLHDCFKFTKNADESWKVQRIAP